jgi:hypothetical protein
VRDYPFVGALLMPLRSTPGGASPPGVTPLAVDLFTSRDFYQDRAHWTDPRYSRCDSPQSIKALQGALTPVFMKVMGDAGPRTTPWGHCDRDYPREAIVSPYRFSTARAHYEALEAEMRGRRCATAGQSAALPTDWSGRYRTVDMLETWYGMMLVNWTSNVQGWTAHGAFEFSNKMQTVEIHTPVHGPDGRTVRNLDRVGGLNEGDPHEFIECFQSLFPVKGIATPVHPGQVIEYTVSDMYDRPWARIQEQYFEAGMKRPEAVDTLGFK